MVTQVATGYQHDASASRDPRTRQGRSTAFAADQTPRPSISRKWWCWVGTKRQRLPARHDHAGGTGSRRISHICAPAHWL